MFDAFLKAAGTELGAFIKRMQPKFAALADLELAANGCKSKEARAMIEGLIAPLEKELQKECSACSARIVAAWRKAKGQEPPPDVQKKITDLYKKSAKAMESSGVPKVKPGGYKGGFVEGITLNFSAIKPCYLGECR